jgi:hypothetical protein
MQVVQINPDDKVFGGCLGFVDKFGADFVQVAVVVPGKGTAFVRLNYDDLEVIGKAKWEVEL